MCASNIIFPDEKEHTALQPLCLWSWPAFLIIQAVYWGRFSLSRHLAPRLPRPARPAPRPPGTQTAALNDGLLKRKASCCWIIATGRNRAPFTETTRFIRGCFSTLVCGLCSVWLTGCFVYEVWTVFMSPPGEEMHSHEHELLIYSEGIPHPEKNQSAIDEISHVEQKQLSSTSNLFKPLKKNILQLRDRYFH